MNNQQFRRLLFSDSSTPAPQNASPSQQKPSATPALGSRLRSSIPMTPRHIPGQHASTGGAHELFQRQLREQQTGSSPAGNKKFKSSAAPKGSKLAAGYTDRAAQLRATEDEEGKDENSKEARIQALEDMVKLGQMEQADFERARDGIVGGDVRNVHLVKGLDRRLLRRARAGEDVFAGDKGEEGTQGEGEEVEEVDVDGELEGLESAAVRPLEREERVKQGALPVVGAKRTRDDILREMKEARARAAAEQQAARQPVLGDRFRKIGPKHQPGTSRIERDEMGREVLIVVDERGNVKRKVKKQKVEAGGAGGALPMPDKDVVPLGGDVLVPENRKEAKGVVDEDGDGGDIFADAGSDYNPLGDIGDGDEDSDSDESEDGETKERVGEKPKNATAIDTLSATQDEKPSTAPPSKARNYFGSDIDESPSSTAHSNPMTDPSILNALKRASASKAAEATSEASGDPDVEKARLARVRARLAEQDRDAEDMDMGFGSSRFEDQDEGEERPVKLTKWKGLQKDGDGNEEGEEDGEHGGRGGQQQKKSGKKKRKGDKNDASTVLGVMERRKGKV